MALSTFPELADLVAADLYAGTALWRFPELVDHGPAPLLHARPERARDARDVPQGRTRVPDAARLRPALPVHARGGRRVGASASRSRRSARGRLQRRRAAGRCRCRSSSTRPGRHALRCRSSYTRSRSAGSAFRRFRRARSATSISGHRGRGALPGGDGVHAHVRRGKADRISRRPSRCRTAPLDAESSVPFSSYSLWSAQAQARP